MTCCFNFLKQQYGTLKGLYYKELTPTITINDE